MKEINISHSHNVDILRSMSQFQQQVLDEIIKKI